VTTTQNPDTSSEGLDLQEKEEDDVHQVAQQLETLRQKRYDLIEEVGFLEKKETISKLRVKEVDILQLANKKLYN
jgi:hypothetical protein